MSFTPLAKPARRGGSASPMITIGHADQDRQTYLSLNTAARSAIGGPGSALPCLGRRPVPPPRVRRVAG